MIRLSKLSDYAVVVLSQLAREQGKLVSASGLAESTGIPEPTVSKVLKVLVKGNIIVSTRGATGGYMMERSPDDITVRELIEALEGPIAVTSCVEEHNTECGIGHICAMRGKWHKVNSAIVKTLDEMHLTELLLKPSPTGRGLAEGPQSQNLTPLARNLRQNSTEAEKLFWSKVCDRQFLDLKFKRQEEISGFIADFVCYETRLIVELDGGQHTEEADRERTRILESEGFLVKRYWNNDVLKNIEGVLTDLSMTIDAAKTLTPTLSLQGEGAIKGVING